MFISDIIPENYNRIAEISDNYIILVRENVLNNNNSYDAYIQFFSPSTEVVHLNNYRITKYNNITYNYIYNNNQFYNYIDYVTTEFSLNTILLEDRNSELFNRHDYWSIGLMVALLLCLVILIVNLATSIVHRGGIFHA